VRNLIVVVAVGLLAAVAGCQKQTERSPGLGEKIDQLRLEKTELQYEVEQYKAENEKLRAQVQVLSGLGSQLKPENIYELQTVKLARYTGLYDEDNDGKKERLVVYLQPIDREGDVIKAAGSVDVQLWDLNKSQDKALLGQWHVTAAELKKLWYALIRNNYKLTFDLGGTAGSVSEPLTVKVTFTDYLSGRVFQQQAVIEP